MSDPGEDLERALEGLAAMVRAKRKPTRQEARALLIALGRVLADEPEAIEALAPRIREAVGPLLESWEAAVQDELALACAEHVQGVDPRYLGHPRYDFEYTLEARRRLAARLRAAAALGHALPEAWARDVERADALLTRALPEAWRSRATDLFPGLGRS
jgi:hypothetical protein